jgi:hypothetical protein
MAQLPTVVQLKHATREEKDCLVTMAKRAEAMDTNGDCTSRKNSLKLFFG